MPQQPNFNKRGSSAASSNDTLDLILSLPQPVSAAVSPHVEDDAAHNDMWLVIDHDRPVITFRQQVLDAWIAECRHIGMAVAGHG
jgi:hypothetical protein